MIRKISIHLLLGCAISLVNSSLWRERVFPNDKSWVLSQARWKLADAEKESSVENNYKVCETEECKTIANEFLKSINKSVNPCDDFYEFACSGWAAHNPIPPSRPSWSRFAMFEMAVQLRIRDILATEPEPSDILPVRQAKKWYQSCMDTEGREKRGLKPIESILLRAGGWPIIIDENEWDPDEASWREIELNYARLTGSYTFYNFHSLTRMEIEETHGDLIIHPPDLPVSERLPLKYRNYTGNDHKQYVRLISDIATLFVKENKADVSEEKIKKDAEDIVEFEKKIYELTQKEDSAMMTLEEFYEWYDTNVTESDDSSEEKIDWERLVEQLFDTVHVKVPSSTDVYLAGLDYIKGIGKLLSETPERTIVNYIHWNFVGSMLAYTTEAMSDDLFKFVGEEYGMTEKPPRWSECYDDMQMTHAAAYAFVQKYFTNHTEKEILKLIKNVQVELEKQINNSNWLDADSKIFASKKLNSMKIFVGYPDWYKDKKSVINSYKGLNVGREYFDNALSFMRYEKKKNLKSILSYEEEDDDPWYMDPITVNALYGPEKNAINIPAADLQSPLFTPHLPDYVNYGIVGVLVGHEMGHGFDDEGIKYDLDGNETRLPESVLKNYYQRADCFTDQFDEYYGETSIPETATTSESEESRESRSLLTRGENIADSTGMQAVFEAYHKLSKPEGSVKLPGFEEFTDDQLFFISFASTWCVVDKPEFAEIKRRIRDPHSPPKLRVIGALSNTKDFAKAFDCPAGSPMNPINKCSIWQKINPTLEKKIAKLTKKRNRWERQWKG